MTSSRQATASSWCSNTWAEWCRRTLAAIEDLDAAEFLPERRPAFSLANGLSILFGAAYRMRRALR